MEIYLYPDLIAAELGLGTFTPPATPEEYEDVAATAVGLFPEGRGVWKNCLGEIVPDSILENLGQMYNLWLEELWLGVTAPLLHSIRTTLTETDEHLLIPSDRQTLEVQLDKNKLLQGMGTGEGYVSLKLHPDVIYIILDRMTEVNGLLPTKLIKQAQRNPEEFITNNIVWLITIPGKGLPKINNEYNWENIEWELRQDFITANLKDLLAMDFEFCLE